MGTRTNTAKWLEKQKRWQIKVQKDGERRTFTSSTPGRTGQREANSKADEWLDEGIANTSVKVSALFAEFIEEKKQTTSQSNWRPIESLWKQRLKPAYGNKKIGAITEHDLQKPINQGVADGLSKKTLINMLGIQKAFIKFCRKKKCCNLYPENVTIPKSAQYKGRKIMQPHDIIKLFNCEQTTWWGREAFDEYVYAYRFQVSTGLRPGELIGLRWSDLKGKVLHVRRAINHFNEETTGKNNNARRNITLNAVEMQLLEKQKELSPPAGDNSIFQIKSQYAYEKRWDKFREHNGLSPVSPYELRHTFVSMNKTLPAGQLKDIVGHAKDMDTFGIYGHHMDGEGSQVAAARESIMKAILEQKK